MRCTKCKNETDTLYKVSENSESGFCPECAGSGELVFFFFLLFAVILTFLGMLAG